MRGALQHARARTVSKLQTLLLALIVLSAIIYPLVTFTLAAIAVTVVLVHYERRLTIELRSRSSTPMTETMPEFTERYLVYVIPSPFTVGEISPIPDRCFTDTAVYWHTPIRSATTTKEWLCLFWCTSLADFGQAATDELETLLKCNSDMLNVHVIGIGFGGLIARAINCQTLPTPPDDRKGYPYTLTTIGTPHLGAFVSSGVPRVFLPQIIRDASSTAMRLSRLCRDDMFMRNVVSRVFVGTALNDWIVGDPVNSTGIAFANDGGDGEGDEGVVRTTFLLHEDVCPLADCPLTPSGRQNILKAFTGIRLHITVGPTVVDDTLVAMVDRDTHTRTQRTPETWYALGKVVDASNTVTTKIASGAGD